MNVPTALYDVIDATGALTGEKVTREHASEHGLMIRYIQVWLFNSQGHIMVGQRAENRKVRPNLLDSGCAGHVDLGETFEQAAARELKEETGLEIPVEPMFDIWGQPGQARIFRAFCDNLPPVDPAEMSLVEFRSIDDLLWLKEKFPYTMAFGLRVGLEKYQEWRMMNHG